MNVRKSLKIKSARPRARCKRRWCKMLASQTLSSSTTFVNGLCLSVFRFNRTDIFLMWSCINRFCVQFIRWQNVKQLRIKRLIRISITELLEHLIKALKAVEMASVTKWSVALLALSFFDCRKFLILLFLAALIKVIAQEWTTRPSSLTVYRSAKTSVVMCLSD